MDFRLEEKQEWRRARAAAFSDEEVRPLWERFEADQNLIKILARRAGEQGILDECIGGDEQKRGDLIPLVATIEELSRGEPALGLLLGNRALCRRAVELFGDSEFEKRLDEMHLWSSNCLSPVWLGMLSSQEPWNNIGLDAAASLSRDRLRAGDSFSLADAETVSFLGCLVARHQGRNPEFMICLLQPSMGAIQISPSAISPFALRAIRFSQILIEKRIERNDCFRSFAGADEFHRFITRLSAERAVIFGAIALGIARAAFEYALAYSKRRTSFGKPIGLHQAIAIKLADIGTDVEAMRLFLWDACSRSEEPEFEANALRAWELGSEIAFDAAAQAVQIFGGHGYLRLQPVEKLLRDIQGLRILYRNETGQTDNQCLIST